MTGKRFFRLIRRTIVGLPHNERLRRTTLERKAAYIAFLKTEGRTISADNNTEPWKL